MAVNREPWIVRSGWWLTKRRGVILAPLFAVALVAARTATSWRVELGRDLVGMLCLFAGTRLRLVAASYHESEHGHSPITAGPYAWIRHPLYVANFLLGFGIVLVAGWWPVTAAYVFLFLPLHAIIMRAEEIHLTRLYGEAYAAYRRAVPAVIPWRRYRGPQEGQRNEFKLRRGHERLKVVGYALGVSLLLGLKPWRQALAVVTIPPLSIATGMIAGSLAVMAIIVRARLRRPWVRGLQTAMAVIGVLILVVHLPGVWPTAPTPAFVSQPASAVPAAVQFDARPPTSHAPASPPRRGLCAYLPTNPEVLLGVATFGLAGLVEDAFGGHQWARGDELSEAGQAALVAAMAIGLWKQWRAASPSAWSSSEGPWQFQVRPVYDRHDVAMTATVRRRF